MTDDRKTRPAEDLLSRRETVMGDQRGKDGDTLNSVWAEWLGLPTGIPVAPAEGDQPVSLARSLIAAAGDFASWRGHVAGA